MKVITEYLTSFIIGSYNPDLQLYAPIDQNICFYETSLLDCDEPPINSFWQKYPGAFTQCRSIFNLPKQWKWSDYVCRYNSNLRIYECHGIIVEFQYKGDQIRYSPKYDKIFKSNFSHYVEYKNPDPFLLFIMRELYDVKKEEIYVL